MGGIRTHTVQRLKLLPPTDCATTARMISVPGCQGTPRYTVPPAGFRSPRSPSGLVLRDRKFGGERSHRTTDPYQGSPHLSKMIREPTLVSSIIGVKQMIRTSSVAAPIAFKASPSPAEFAFQLIGGRGGIRTLMDCSDGA